MCYYVCKWGSKEAHFVAGVMLKKLGNGMKERELQKCCPQAAGHQAASRMTTQRLADPWRSAFQNLVFLSGEVRSAGNHLAASRVTTWRLAFQNVNHSVWTSGHQAVIWRPVDCSIGGQPLGHCQLTDHPEIVNSKENEDLVGLLSGTSTMFMAPYHGY